jgi:hypothetical protein
MGLEVEHKERVMKSLFTGAVLITSLVLGGNAAMAANRPAHKTARVVPHARAAIRVAPRLPSGQFNADIGQFIQSMLGGGPVQYSRLTQDAMRARPSHGSAGATDWSPSYDNSPTIDSSSSASDSQAASDAENQAIQSMNDENALNASMATAEAQNDAANAATIQTEINANN